VFLVPLESFSTRRVPSEPSAGHGHFLRTSTSEWIETARRLTIPDILSKLTPNGSQRGSAFRGLGFVDDRARLRERHVDANSCQPDTYFGQLRAGGEPCNAAWRRFGCARPGPTGARSSASGDQWRLCTIFDS